MTKIVGILNITPDSFSDGGNFENPQLALQHTQKMINEGVNIIDIGAESTRPGAQKVSVTQELSRLEPVLEEIISLAKDNRVQTSIDTYKPRVAEFAISCGVDFVNDVTGFINAEMVKIAAENNVKIVVTHSLGVPVNKSVTIPENVNVMDEIFIWARDKIVQLTNYGIDQKNIIIDPGIGFGKNDEQSWYIVNNIEKLHALKTEIYVGHSRKRFLNLDSQINRDSYTLAISAVLALKKVHYIRVHNVSIHTGLIKKIIFE